MFTNRILLFRQYTAQKTITDLLFVRQGQALFHSRRTLTALTCFDLTRASPTVPYLSHIGLHAIVVNFVSIHLLTFILCCILCYLR